MLTSFFGFFLAFLDHKCFNVTLLVISIANALRKIKLRRCTFGRQILAFSLCILWSVKLWVAIANADVRTQSATGSSCGILLHGAIETIIVYKHLIIARANVAINIEATTTKRRLEDKTAIRLFDLDHYVFECQARTLELAFAEALGLKFLLPRNLLRQFLVIRKQRHASAFCHSLYSLWVFLLIVVEIVVHASSYGTTQRESTMKTVSKVFAALMNDTQSLAFSFGTALRTTDVARCS